MTATPILHFDSAHLLELNPSSATSGIFLSTPNHDNVGLDQVHRLRLDTGVRIVALAPLLFDNLFCQFSHRVGQLSGRSSELTPTFVLKSSFVTAFEEIRW